MQKQKATIKTLCMSRKVEEPKQLVDNMGAMTKHLEGIAGCDAVGELYAIANTHIELAEAYEQQLTATEADIAAKEKKLVSSGQAIEEGWIQPECEVAKRQQEVDELKAALVGLKADRNLTELKMILGNNYVGEEAWAKLDITVSPKDLPAITDDLISRVKAMQTKGEQPIFVLDLGKSIKAMEALCQSKDITAFSTEYGGDEKLRGEDCYTTAGPEGARWLLLPGSDHGVLPGSRMKTYEEQVQHMEANYPGYEVGGARELVTLAMLKYLQDGTVLFGTTGSAYGTYARCKGQFQKAGGGWDDYQIGLGGNEENGSSGVSGLVVDCVHSYDPHGLLCVLSGVPALLKNT